MTENTEKLPAPHPTQPTEGTERYFFRASAADFKKIPGSPIAYWVKPQISDAFSQDPALGQLIEIKAGMSTTDNQRFLRLWHEVNCSDFETKALNKAEASDSGKRWFPYIKGGKFRRWFGNNEYVANWKSDGADIKQYIAECPEKQVGGRLVNMEYFFRPCLAWTRISSSEFSCRFYPAGSIFSDASNGGFGSHDTIATASMLLNSSVISSFLEVISPTINFYAGDILKLPTKQPVTGNEKFKTLFSLSKADWDSYETSWDFTSLPLLEVRSEKWEVRSEEQNKKLSTVHFPLSTALSSAYAQLRKHWQDMTMRMKALEEENNRIFIDAYGLQDELAPEVPLEEITLTCNPYYRYGKKVVISSVESGECEVGSKENFSLPTSHFPLDEELEGRLVADTMKELVSYAVGCMFGRYSLDKPGLVLANQGENIADYYKKLEESRNNGCKELSRTDCLAEGDGFGGDDLSGDTTIPQGGDLRPDESDSPSGSFNSIKHSGRAGEEINSGIQKLSINSAGLPSGSGNATDDCSTPGVSPTGESRANPQSIRGNQTHDLRPDSEAVLTSHSPLPTPHLSFVPDEDNVIPMLDGDWFTDDIAERFRKFLRVAFGEEHYEENLQFVEKALGKNGKARDIRDYFLKDFYSDHVRRYKKRPIYWLFSSPKGSFNALIYMHRYRPDTVSVVLNDYLREFRTKLTAHKHHLEAVSISGSVSVGDKTKALKEIEKVGKMIAELEDYERDVLYPLATQQIELDLDDGVKVNYLKLGPALKKIPGLEAKEEE